MPFLKSTTDAEYGVWFLYGKDTDGKDVRFKVRALSAGKEYEIERRHVGRKSELHYRKGDVIQPGDRDADMAAEIDKSVYSLLDSENCQVVPLDKEAADAYAKALDADVKSGEPLLLDGKWARKDERNRYPLKELFLSDELRVGRKIIKEARKVGVTAAEEEELGKEGSSPS